MARPKKKRHTTSTRTILSGDPRLYRHPTMVYIPRSCLTSVLEPKYGLSLFLLKQRSCLGTRPKPEHPDLEPSWSSRLTPLPPHRRGGPDRAAVDGAPRRHGRRADPRAGDLAPGPGGTRGDGEGVASGGEGREELRQGAMGVMGGGN